MAAHTPADVVRQYLVNQALVKLPPTFTAEVDWPGFANYLPSEPGKALSVNDISGYMDGRDQKSGKTIEHPGIQVLARALNDRIAAKKIKSIADLFDLVGVGGNWPEVSLDDPEEVGVSYTYKIHAIHRTSPVVPLGSEKTTTGGGTGTQRAERPTQELGVSGRRIYSLNCIATIEEH